jgi:hypothetical protein
MTGIFMVFIMYTRISNVITNKMNMKPIIKFNGGQPVCLCHKCYVIIRYLTNEECIQFRDGIKTETVPLHCGNCKNGK